jgi:O-antigen/teichoic acid export membrane protein
LALKHNLSANLLGQASAALLALGFIPVYVGVLGAEGFGLIGLFSALYAVLSVVDASIQAWLARSAAQGKAAGQMADLAHRLRTLELLLVCAAGLIVASVAWGADVLGAQALQPEHLSADALSTAFLGMSVALSLRLFEGLYRACLMGLERQVLFNALFIAAQVLRWAGAAAVLLWVSPTVEAFFAWQAGVALLSVLVLGIAAYACVGQMAQARPRWQPLWQERRFVAGMAVISAAAVLLTQTDKLLLAHLLPLAAFGDYALAATAAAALLLLVGPVADALYPRLVRHWAAGDTHAYARDFHLGAQLVTVLAGSVACAGLVFAPAILSVWTGDAALAQRVAPLLQILLLGNLLNALMWLPYRAQLAAGWTGLSARINVVAVLCLVPVILVVAPRYGAEGAAWVWVALNAGYVTIGVHFMFARLLTTEKLRWYLTDIALPFLACALPVVGIGWLTVAASPLLHLGAALAAVGLALLWGGLAAAQLRPQLLSVLFRTPCSPSP